MANKEDYTQKLLREREGQRREEALRKDPSSIPGLTQTELNQIIDRQ
jgi:hypothetical protein